MQGIGWDLWMLLSGRLDVMLSGGLGRRNEQERGGRMFVREVGLDKMMRWMGNWTGHKYCQGHWRRK